MKQRQGRNGAFGADRVCEPPLAVDRQRLADEQQRARSGVCELKCGIGQVVWRDDQPEQSGNAPEILEPGRPLQNS